MLVEALIDYVGLPGIDGKSMSIHRQSREDPDLVQAQSKCNSTMRTQVEVLKAPLLSC